MKILWVLADLYALLSAEYSWVIDMHKSFNTIPLRYFPNFSLSAALAIDMRQQHGSKRSTPSGGRRLGSTEEDGSELDMDAQAEASAREALIDALLTFPMALRPLLEAVGDQSTAWAESRLYDAAWHGAGVEDAGILTRMARVYAERSKLL